MDEVTSSGSAGGQSLERFALIEMPIGLGVSQRVVEWVDGDGDNGGQENGDRNVDGDGDKYEDGDGHKDEDGAVVIDVGADVETVVEVNFGMMERVKMVPESASPVMVVATMVMVGWVVWVVAGAIPIYVIMAMVVAVVLVVGVVVVGVMVGLGHEQCEGIFEPCKGIFD